MRRQHPGQGLIHLSCPPAHEPTQRLWQSQTGMHRWHGALHQQCRLKAVVNQRGQAALSASPPKGAEQSCRIIGPDGEHHHIELRRRGVFQQLEQTCRVESVGCQHAPVGRVMLAQATHQLTTQSLLLRWVTHTCCTRVAGHQQAQPRATARSASAAARRFWHTRCESPHMRCLQPRHRPKHAHQQQALPSQCLRYVVAWNPAFRASGLVVSWHGVCRQVVGHCSRKSNDLRNRGKSPLVNKCVSLEIAPQIERSGAAKRSGFDGPAVEDRAVDRALSNTARHVPMTSYLRQIEALRNSLRLARSACHPHAPEATIPAVPGATACCPGCA